MKHVRIDLSRIDESPAYHEDPDLYTVTVRKRDHEAAAVKLPEEEILRALRHSHQRISQRGLTIN